MLSSSFKMELIELRYEPATRPFQCDWDSCNKSFKRKSDLPRHYKTHTNERLYSCSIPGCRKSFIQRSALTVHIRTHTGEKPHQCQHMGCGKRFCDPSSLARHRHIHGKRPYKCAHDGCTKSFSRKATMAKHQRRSHQRGSHSNEILDDYSSDSNMGEAPRSPTQTGNPWPISTIVPDQPIHLMHCAASVPDQMHQSKVQNIGDYSVQQPSFVSKPGNSDIAPMSTNIQPPVQVSRNLMPPSSVAEMAYVTQSITTPSSGPSLSPTVYQSPPIDCNFYALAPPENLQAICSAPAIQQQSMSQDTWQASQPTQANPEHYPFPVEAQQFHTVGQHDLAFKGYGEAFNQDDACVVEPEDEAPYRCNMGATVEEYPLISQTAKYDLTQMRDALIWPICSYTSESVALLDLDLGDEAQYLDQYVAPADNWNGSFIGVCYWDYLTKSE